MYTRITQSGPRRYLQLVQGYRDENGKAKQRVVASLGRIDQLEASDLEALIKGLQRAAGRPESLPEAPRSSRRQFDAEALIRAMVFNRLAAPGSKLSMLEWLREDVSVPGLDIESMHHEHPSSTPHGGFGHPKQS